MNVGVLAADMVEQVELTASPETLTAAGRRDLYARIAAAFEELYASALDDHVERLAHYHAQSGNLPRALEYAERARAG